MKVSLKDFSDVKTWVHWAMIAFVVLSVAQYGFFAALAALAVTDVVAEKMLGL